MKDRHESEVRHHLNKMDALPEEFTVDDDVIRDAVSRATVETNAEYLDGLHDIIKLAITPLLQVMIEKRVDEFLENYKLEGTFK